MARKREREWEEIDVHKSVQGRKGTTGWEYDPNLDMYVGQIDFGERIVSLLHRAKTLLPSRRPRYLGAQMVDYGTGRSTERKRRKDARKRRNKAIATAKRTRHH